MPKPITHDRGPEPGTPVYLDVDEIFIGAWCPDPNAETPPTQVHMRFEIADLPIPIVCRWKGPDTIGVIIEQLIEYRDLVWPGEAGPAEVHLSPATFPEANIVYTPPLGMSDCGDLHCHRQRHGNDPEGDEITVLSRWMLSDAARRLVAMGASVWLTVWGGQPPVALSVSEGGPFEPAVGPPEEQ